MSETIQLQPADSYAKHGFLSIAPALFDRIEKSVELGYAREDRVRAMEFFKKLDFANAVRDVDAALSWARKTSGNKKTGAIGFAPEERQPGWSRRASTPNPRN